MDKRKDTLTVLVTGAGAPGIAGTIYALRNNPDAIAVRIVAVDMREEVVGKYLADAFYVVPPGGDSTFIPSLLEIAQKEAVDAILPQVTNELLPLAQARAKFESIGVSIVISSFSAVQKAIDKLSLLAAAEQIGVPYPQYQLATNKQELIQAVNSLGYPARKVVVKPRISCGMRGLRIISNRRWDVRRFLEEKPEGIEISLEELIAILGRGSWPELVVSEYLPGAEYTVDVFRGKHINVAIPRLREQIRSGITFRSKTELRRDLINYSLRLAEHLDLRYCFGFQFRQSEDGVLKIIECNPRVQGTMIAGVLAGFNLVYYAVMEAIGKSSVKSSDLKGLHDGLRFLRYWGGVAAHDSRFLGRI